MLPGKAKNLSIVKTAPTDISEINRKDVGKPAKVSGVLDKKISLNGGHMKLILKAGKNKLDIFLPKSITESKRFSKIKVGQRIRVSGSVQIYQGNLEIEVEDVHNISIIEDPR